MEDMPTRGSWQLGYNFNNSQKQLRLIHMRTYTHMNVIKYVLKIYDWLYIVPTFYKIGEVVMYFTKSIIHWLVHSADKSWAKVMYPYGLDEFHKTRVVKKWCAAILNLLHCGWSFFLVRNWSHIWNHGLMLCNKFDDCPTHCSGWVLLDFKFWQAWSTCFHPLTGSCVFCYTFKKGDDSIFSIVFWTLWNVWIYLDSTVGCVIKAGLI